MLALSGSARGKPLPPESLWQNSEGLAESSDVASLLLSITLTPQQRTGSPGPVQGAVPPGLQGQPGAVGAGLASAVLNCMRF